MQTSPLPFVALFAMLTAAAPARAEIGSVSAIECAEVDPSIAGTLDWITFGPADGHASQFRAAVWKFGGKGIAAPHVWKGASFTIEFAGPGEQHRALASVILTACSGLRVTARQGDRTRTLETTGAENVIQVRYGGAASLQIEIVPAAGSTLDLHGFDATLSEPGFWWVRDHRLALFYQPLSGDELRRRMYRGQSPDYLATARAFADQMLRYGRDHYGRAKSPLFSNILTRAPRPETTPYPLFAPRTDVQRRKAASRPSEGPFQCFDFNHLLNYPDGLGPAGPHKITLYGADPFEDRELYYTLFELSRITGDSKYRDAASAAIRWWFRNTQGPSGLYPWGEHLGWDLVNDAPTYFAGPSEHLYRANQHEVRDFVPFIEYLIALPATTKGGLTPLERYAFGIWEQHFWDKEKAYFDRHGDYTGNEQASGLGAFPAHLAFYLRVWTAAYLGAHDDQVRERLAGILDRVATMAVKRTERWGFFPMDLRPEFEGADPGNRAPAQSIRLAHHAAWLATQLEPENPRVAGKLRRLSELHLGKQPYATTLRNLAWAKATGDNSFIQGTRDTRLPAAGRPPLSAAVMADDYATQILVYIRKYRERGNETDLRFAKVYARLAHERFIDGTSPLPRAFAAGAPIRARDGEPFPDFYFHGAKLMRAFALLGEISQQQKSKR